MGRIGLDGPAQFWNEDFVPSKGGGKANGFPEFEVGILIFDFFLIKFRKIVTMENPSYSWYERKREWKILKKIQLKTEKGIDSLIIDPKLKQQCRNTNKR